MEKWEIGSLSIQIQCNIELIVICFVDSSPCVMLWFSSVQRRGCSSFLLLSWGYSVDAVRHDESFLFYFINAAGGGSDIF